MKTKAFIIANNKVVAEVETDLGNGADIIFGYQKVEEHINANRKWNLVNSKNGKISRAKKWRKIFNGQAEGMQYGNEINQGEFFIR
ncbi:hypothetical protein EBX31_01800 [bacterium]|nr:hypothetical protein [bacterium]